MAAVITCCAAVSANGQVWDESNFGGLTPEMSQKSNPEFGNKADAAYLNYEEAIRQKGPYQDLIKHIPGNRVQEPVILESEDINGTHFDLYAVGAYFFQNLTWGAGIGGGHDYRKWEWGVGGNFVIGTPDEESDVHDKFFQVRGEAEAGIKLLQTANHHNYLSWGVGYSCQLSDYFNKNKYEFSGQTTNEDGTIVNRTTTQQDLHNRQLTSGVYTYLKWNMRKAFSSHGGYIKFIVGYQQNIVLNTNKKGPEVRVVLAYELRPIKHRSFNHAGMSYCGYNSESEVWQLRSEMRPYQTPGK